jgi:hypothetical protein
MAGKTRAFAIFAGTVVCAGGALLLSDFFIRTKELWWIVPRKVLDFIVKIYGPVGQEEIANGEYIAYFTVTFVLLAIVLTVVVSCFRSLNRERKVRHFSD